MELLVEEGAAVPLGVLVLALMADIRVEVNERLGVGDALLGKLLGESVRKRGEDDVALLDNSVRILANLIVY